MTLIDDKIPHRGFESDAPVAAEGSIENAKEEKTTEESIEVTDEEAEALLLKMEEEFEASGSGTDKKVVSDEEAEALLKQMEEDFEASNAA